MVLMVCMRMAEIKCTPQPTTLQERGVVWEESIVLAPKSARFAFLSATIPNAREFAEWVAKVGTCLWGGWQWCCLRLGGLPASSGGGWQGCCLCLGGLLASSVSFPSFLYYHTREDGACRSPCAQSCMRLCHPSCA